MKRKVFFWSSKILLLFLFTILLSSLLLFPGCSPISNLLFGAPGSLEVTTYPSGAKIFLNGSDTGYLTPYTISNLPKGTYEVKVVLEELSYTKTVIVYADNTTSLYKDLLSQLNKIMVEPNSMNIEVGVSQNIASVTAYYIDSPSVILTLSDCSYSSSSNHATVSSSGVITGVSAGSVIITVSYTDLEITKTALINVTVTAAAKEEQSAPTGLVGVAPTTYGGSDGKINGTTTLMEYKLSTDSTYTAATASPTTVGIAGDYVVRYAAKPGFNPGATTVVTVPAGPILITAIDIISGIAQEGQVLTAGALTPAAATATYQWRISLDGTSYTNIIGATATIYTPVADNVAKFIKVVATGTGSYSGTVTSAATSAVVAAAEIAAAGVAGFVAPVTGGIAQVFGNLIAGAATYTVTGLTWAPVHATFGGKTAYTATVVLTSAAGNKFPVTGIEVPTANGGGTVSAGTTNGGDVSGNKLSFAVLFPETATVVIGDSCGGGKVAYILVLGDPGYDANAQHGLIATTADLSAGIAWGCYGFAISGADGTAIGTGKQNTIDIMAGCSTAGIAARLCGDLVFGGYSDWYLPSSDELNQLYLNRVAIGGFSPSVYWSSSEQDANYAYHQDFYNGYRSSSYKNSTYRSVRAVRSF